MTWFSVDEILGGKCPSGLRQELEPAYRLVEGRRVWVLEDVEQILERVEVAA